MTKAIRKQSAKWACDFKGLEFLMTEQGPGGGGTVAGTAERTHLDPQPSEARRRHTEKPFGTSKPTPSDTPPRPHLLILPKQFHQLGPKYSNGGHSPSNHQVLSSDSVLCQGFISLALHVPEQVVIFSKRWSFLIGVLLACVSVRGCWLRPHEHFLFASTSWCHFLFRLPG